MKNNNSNAFMLLTGIIAGGAAVYFLKSEKGKQIIDLALTKGEELTNTIQDHSKKLLEEGKSLVDNAMDATNQTISDTKSTLMSAAGNIENKVSEFQQGVNKAKKELNNA